MVGQVTVAFGAICLVLTIRKIVYIMYKYAYIYYVYGAVQLSKKCIYIMIATGIFCGCWSVGCLLPSQSEAIFDSLRHLSWILTQYGLSDKGHITRSEMIIPPLSEVYGYIGFTLHVSIYVYFMPYWYENFTPFYSVVPALTRSHKHMRWHK